MSSTGNVVRMGDVVEFQNGGGFKSSEFTSSGAPVIRVSDFTADSVDVTNCRFLSAGSLSTYDRFLLRKGDVVVSTVGSWPTSPTSPVGKVVLIPEEADGYLLNQNAVRLRAIEEWTTQRFVHYLAKTDGFKHYIAVHARGSANHARIAIGVLKDFELVLPPLPIQRRIAEILGRLDDKIEVNRRINRTLEQMAQALYKHWFVDFGPFQDGEFVESEVGLIPAGWSVKPIGEVCNLTMGLSPKSKFYNEDGEGLPFHQGVTDFGDRFPIHRRFCVVSPRVAETGDILISVRAPVGRINIADRKMVIGRGLAALSHKQGYNSFLLYQLKRIFAIEDSMGSGTIFRAISKKDLQGLKLISPPDSVVSDFDRRVSVYDWRITSSTIESRQLAATRDYLLPKLLSGAVDVSGSLLDEDEFAGQGELAG